MAKFLGAPTSGSQGATTWARNRYGQYTRMLGIDTGQAAVREKERELEKETDLEKIEELQKEVDELDNQVGEQLPIIEFTHSKLMSWNNSMIPFRDFRVRFCPPEREEFYATAKEEINKEKH